MSTKYIALYEEYNMETATTGSHVSWPDIRDAIQSKLPFMIIDFIDSDSRDKCKFDELSDINTSYQILNMGQDNSNDEKSHKYPSIFIFEHDDALKDKVLNLNSRYKIFRIIIGEFGKDTPTLYKDGENVDYPRNMMSTNDPQEMGGDDYYKNDSTYYKFID